MWSGPGRVGRDELHVDAPRALRPDAAPGLGVREHAGDELLQGRVGQPQVEEAGRRDRHGRDRRASLPGPAALGRQLRGDRLGDPQGRHPVGPGELHRQARGEVAVLGVGRPFDLDRRQVRAVGSGREGAGRDGALPGGGDGVASACREGISAGARLVHRAILPGGRRGTSARSDLPGCTPRVLPGLVSLRHRFGGCRGRIGAVRRGSRGSTTRPKVLDKYRVPGDDRCVDRVAVRRTDPRGTDRLHSSAAFPAARSGTVSMNSTTAPQARRRASTFRRFGWLAVALLVTLSLVGPGAAGVAAVGSRPRDVEWRPAVSRRSTS